MALSDNLINRRKRKTNKSYSTNNLQISSNNQHLINNNIYYIHSPYNVVRAALLRGMGGIVRAMAMRWNVTGDRRNQWRATGMMAAAVALQLPQA